MADVNSTLDKVQKTSKSPSDLASTDLVELMKDLPQKQELLGQVNKELAAVKSQVVSFGEGVESLSKPEFLKVFAKHDLGMWQLSVGSCRRLLQFLYLLHCFKI